MIANGHNDLWVAAGVLVAFGLIQCQRHLWLVFPMLLCSVFTKYASILVLPFLVLHSVRNRYWKALLPGVGLSAILLFLLAWPYLHLPSGESLPLSAMATNAGMTQHSLASMVSRLVFYISKWMPGLPTANLDGLRAGLKPVLWGGFFMVYVWQIIAFWKRLWPAKPTEQHNVTAQPLILSSVVVMVVLITIASSKFHAWYLGMFFPLVFLLEPTHWCRRFVLWLSVFQLLSFTPVQNIHVLNYALLTLTPLYFSLKEDFKKAFI